MKSDKKNDIAISVKKLSKAFKLPHEKKTSLKEYIMNRKKTSYDVFTALQEISFEVKRGEFFGIVGRNGSGKSTLLKLLGGIYQPTTGIVSVDGTLTPFIELGIGFNPELTGRENVFLNGAILGLTRKEVLDKYDEIVEFAELDKFMDQKLKNYSSGMQVRLAFSIAIRAHNDVLLIDEVLAVGDSSFQRKCFQVFKDMKKQGKTVVFVTHDMGAVQEFCDRAMMIQDSKIVMIGKPRDVALRYEMANSVSAQAAASGEVMKHDNSSNTEVRMLGVSTRSAEKRTTNFLRDEKILVDVDFKILELKEAVQFNVFLVKPDGTYLAGINTVEAFGNYSPKPGKHRITLEIAAGQLVKGDYFVNSGVYTRLEPARLIDILDTSYGHKVPKISIMEISPTQNGEFNLQARWLKGEM